jgi:glutaredoxin 3
VRFLGKAKRWAAARAGRSTAGEASVVVPTRTAPKATPTVLLGDPDQDAQVYGRASCTFSGRARRLLEAHGVHFTYVDLDAAASGSMAATLASETGQSTVPYVFVRGRFVGGYDGLSEVVRLGQLQSGPRDRVEVMTQAAPTIPRLGTIELRPQLADEGGERSTRRARPTRPSTHTPAALAQLLDLGLDVEDLAAGDPVTPAMIDAVAEDHGVPVARVLAGAAGMEGLRFARESTVLFEVCTGQCQSWGALDRLEHLATLRAQRREAGLAFFDLRPRACLDRCAQAPVVVVHTPDGVAALDRVADAHLTEAADQLC